MDKERGVQSNLVEDRLRQALGLLRRAVEEGGVPAIATAVSLNEELLVEQAFGTPGWAGGEPPLETTAPFLVASITKPVVCAGAMLLLQRGQMSLADPVAHYLLAFGAHGKSGINLRHLMTHTSGLPDQLEQNVALRKEHAGLDRFVAAVCDLEPQFAPGTRVSYQSMGLLMLGHAMEQVTGQPLRTFLQENLFAPLGMHHTTLGLPAGGLGASVRANDSPVETQSSVDSDWGWNSTYWRDLGAPWGGLHSTAGDLSRLLRHMLGVLPGPLSPAARRAMLRDQIATMPSIPSGQRAGERYGLGFRLGAPAYGDLVSPDTFGHTGATGTLFWSDPLTGLSCVLLTNRPECRSLMARFSNAVAAAVAG
ncbi:MAG: serine hydrolase domain-containing protein [Anaerolineae bacterium]